MSEVVRAPAGEGNEPTPWWVARETAIVGSLVALGIGIRLWLGNAYIGFLTGDDVEILERAFATAFGQSFAPWEIRNLALPDLIVAPMLRLARALGARETVTLLWAATFPFAAAAGLNTWLIHRLARRLGLPPAYRLLAVGLYGFGWMSLGYGSTVYPRTMSVTLVLLATLVAWNRFRFGPLLAGFLLSGAFALRYSEAVFAVALTGVVMARSQGHRRRWADVALLVVGFMAGTAIGVGWFDAVTWGRPFASLSAFFRYTLVERASSSVVPSQPIHWYFWQLPKWISPALWPLLFLAFWARRGRWLWMMVGIPLLLLSAIHHKELRYLQAAIPFVVLLAAFGAWHLSSTGRRRWVAIVAVLAMAHGALGLRFLRKKSLSAVEAARTLANRPIDVVALSQAWAYGERLFFAPNVVVLALSSRPTESEIESLPTSCDAIGLYRDVVAADAGLRARLALGGFSRSREFSVGASRAVVVFERTRVPGG